MSKEVYKMGQYYLPYVKHGKTIKIFDNKVDGEWEGLKLMEHSYWSNSFVGQVINDLFYNKGKVCWVGDYYDESDFAQVNCDNKQLVKEIGELVWLESSPIKKIKGKIQTSRNLSGCLLVNHTKKEFIDGDEYYQQNRWFETWEGKSYPWCINPLPLLTCTASHSGGSYYGINAHLCGTWFNDELEVVYNYEKEDLIEKGYQQFEPLFSERQ